MNIKRILRNQLKRKNINGKMTEVHKYTNKEKEIHMADNIYENDWT